jgi:hypothetical protein
MEPKPVPRQRPRKHTSGRIFRAGELSERQAIVESLATVDTTMMEVGR